MVTVDGSGALMRQRRTSMHRADVGGSAESTGATSPASVDSPPNGQPPSSRCALVLVAELRDVARDGHRRGVAERAEALAEDPVADVEEQVELALLGATLLDPAEDVDLPADALAARRALAARLLLVELRDAQAELHHAAAVVDDDDGRPSRASEPAFAIAS